MNNLYFLVTHEVTRHLSEEIKSKISYIGITSNQTLDFFDSLREMKPGILNKEK